MSLQNLRDQMPEYAKDIKLNLGSVLGSVEGHMGLTPQQAYAIALASAYATKHPVVIQSIAAEAANVLTEADITAAKAAATIMGMNNVYYRFVHLVSDPDYGKMPAKLRMNIMAAPGVAKVDFELTSLAVSAINGCGMCMDSHVAAVIKEGANRDAVQSTIRIASVIAASAQALVIEQAA